MILKSKFKQINSDLHCMTLDFGEVSDVASMSGEMMKYEFRSGLKPVTDCRRRGKSAHGTLAAVTNADPTDGPLRVYRA